MKKIVLIFLVILVLNLIFGGLATRYVIEFWGTYFKKVPVSAPLLPCCVAGVFLGEFTIPIAIITWIISFMI